MFYSENMHKNTTLTPETFKEYLNTWEYSLIDVNTSYIVGTESEANKS